MPESPINLVVKAPNQAVLDQTFEVQSEWNVMRLKNFLSSAYPSKPLVEEQRLIYSGHLLRDDQILQDIFQPFSGNSVTVHLVCSAKTADLENATNNSRQNEESSNVQPSPANLDHQILQNIAATAVGQNMNMPFVMTPEQMMQQMILMQQMYAQFYSQFPNAIAPDLSQTTMPFNAAPQAAIPVAPQQNNNIPQVQVPPVNVQPQAGPRINAGPAAPVEEEDEANRDWLDWFYWGSRAIVLFSIIYFYSSFSRFLIVIALTVIMYMYQAGWIAQPERNQQQPAARRVGAAADPLRGQENVGGTGEVRVTNNPAETERFSGLRLFWVIVSSLFTSLIPEQVPQNL
ncbi:Homocysteine-responsive endoplasmic reticulum-resident ubiquitin-like domain member 2 protein [Halotydeus destructor]|nr:Homocysteine-responsive endoplasmic reticulum-resident ubiquitin-like domain member 2 protein [Halotydeus destructor]